MIKQKIITFVLTVILSMMIQVSFAYDFKVDGIFYNYGKNEGEVEVTFKKNPDYDYKGNYDAYKGVVVIPETVTYNNKVFKVTAISENAFYGCDKVKSVTLPNSVTKIGFEAFSGCLSLTKPIYNSHIFARLPRNFQGDFIIPSGIKEISSHAFYECKGLTNITIPNSVITIGYEAFSRCGLTNITIPNNIKSLGKQCFSFCDGLTSVIIPNSVTTIGAEAFYRCENLSSVIIGNGVNRIEGSTFSRCTRLSSVHIGYKVTYIGDYAFHDTFLTKVSGLHEGIRLGKDVFDFIDHESPVYPQLFCLKKHKSTFDYYANSHIIPAINDWQKKREFESSDQYMARVTKTNQDKKVQELLNEAIRAYTKEHKLIATLGNYDADYQIYKIQTNYGDRFVKVPQSSASSFKSNFSGAKLDASYIVSNGELAINELTLVVNNNTYKAEKATDLSSSTSYNFELPTLELPHQQQTMKPASQPPSPQNTITTSNNPPKQQVEPGKTEVQTNVRIDLVDTEIPVISRVNKNTFAIIIANEDYQSETKVDFAKNDGEVFKNYCHKTLGLPEKNVHFVANATLNNLIGELDWLQQICDAFGGDASVIFYYAGHGIPDEASGSAYLLPTDGNSRLLRTCFSVNELYETLGKLPAKKVTVLMDACFSGAKRNGGMLAAARSVAIKAKPSAPKGSMIVLSAAQGNETAYKYDDAKHGLFTYFLLKKLKDSNGNVTMGELSNYITEQVKRYSIVENGKSQTPTVQTSDNLRGTWESLRLD